MCTRSVHSSNIYGEAHQYKITSTSGFATPKSYLRGAPMVRSAVYTPCFYPRSFMPFLIEIITSATVAGLLSAALIWFTKSVISERLKNAIKSEYEQKLETHKAQLKSTSDVAIESLKSQLSVIAAQGNFKFTKLHESRAQAIAEIYALLAEFHVALADYTRAFEVAGGTSRTERREIAVKAHGAFDALYRKKKIFLPKSSATKIDDLNHQLKIVYHEFLFGVDMAHTANGDFAQKWIGINEKMSSTIDPALAELEHDFRVLLGDET